MSQRRTHLTMVIALLLLALPVASTSLCAQTPGTVAASVQPFVERQELAGAVMLVADKQKILTVEAVGSADIAAQKPMQADSRSSRPSKSRRWIAIRSVSASAVTP